MERATCFVLVGAIVGSACQTTTTSFLRTGPARAPADAQHVTVSLLEPEDAEPLGIIQAYRAEATSVEDLIPEFMRAAARAGGNYAKIDDLGVKFEQTEDTSTVSYECGTADEPKTCTDTRTDRVEVATLQVVGRAFHVRRRP
jgi:hypothetical protein